MATGANPKPSLGRIVLYRNKDDVDMPAIITGLVPLDKTAVHLHLFPPPGVSADVLSYQWGVDQATEHVLAGRWRWP